MRSPSRPASLRAVRMRTSRSDMVRAPCDGSGESGLRGCLEVVEEEVDCGSVARAPEAGHLPEADRRDQRDAAELIARMGVGDVYLDCRDLDCFDCVAEGHGGVGMAAGVD